MGKETEDEELSLTIPEDFDAQIEGNKLVVGDEEYSLAKIKSEIEQRADENAPATVTFGSSGTVIGAATFGPPGGVVGAVLGSGIGYLIDEGYLSNSEAERAEEVELEDIEHIESETVDVDSEVSEEDLPDIFSEYEDRWYRPDSDIYILTIRTPDGERAYYETIEGAETRLREEYE